MFLSWAKNKVVKWVKNPKNRRKAAQFILPLAAWLFRAYANSTVTKKDDKLADVLDAWSDHL